MKTVFVKNKKDILLFATVFIVTLTVILLMFSGSKTMPFSKAKLVKTYNDKGDIKEDLGWDLSTPININNVELTIYKYFDDGRLVAYFGEEGTITKCKTEIRYNKKYKYNDTIGMARKDCVISGEPLQFYATKWQDGEFYYVIELKNWVDIYKMTDYISATQ